MFKNKIIVKIVTLLRRLILQSYQNTVANSNVQKNDDHEIMVKEMKIVYPLYYWCSALSYIDFQHDENKLLYQSPMNKGIS